MNFCRADANPSEYILLILFLMYERVCAALALAREKNQLDPFSLIKAKMAASRGSARLRWPPAVLTALSRSC